VGVMPGSAGQTRSARWLGCMTARTGFAPRAGTREPGRGQRGLERIWHLDHLDG
jgi:hypothetical protein